MCSEEGRFASPTKVRDIRNDEIVLFGQEGGCLDHPRGSNGLLAYLVVDLLALENRHQIRLDSLVVRQQGDPRKFQPG